MDNVFARTCDSVAELRNHRGSDRSNYHTLGYAFPNDRGAGDFYWDDLCTDPDDDVMVIRVAGVEVGAWRRIMRDNRINAIWFGCKPNYPIGGAPTDSTYDNVASGTRAIEYMKENYQYSQLYFPAGSLNHAYFFRTPFRVMANVHIRGEEAEGLFEFRTIFAFKNTRGVELLGDTEKYFIAKRQTNPNIHPRAYGDTDDWQKIADNVYPSDIDSYVLYQPGTSYAAGTKVRWYMSISTEPSIKYIKVFNNNSRLYQPAGFEDEHGIFCSTKAHISNCYAIGFRGDGIHIEADVMYRPGGTNANIGRLEYCGARYNGGSGFSLQGGDANAWKIDTLDATTNKHYGILDNALLSTSIHNVHTNNNGVYGDTADSLYNGKVYTGSVVRVGNAIYGCQKDGVTTPPPDIPANTPEWQFFASTQDGYFLEAETFVQGQTYNAVLFYQAKATQLDTEFNINRPPTRFGDNDWWTMQGRVGDVLYNGLYFKWNATTKYYGGGAMCSLRKVAASGFYNCYGEMNQGHIIIRGSGYVMGGETGTPVRQGSFWQGGSGGFAVRTGEITAGGYASVNGKYRMAFGESITAMDMQTGLNITAGGPIIFDSPTSTPNFFHDPATGVTRFGNHLPNNMARYEMSYGDLGILNGNIIFRTEGFQKDTIFYKRSGPLSDRPATFPDFRYNGAEWFQTDPGIANNLRLTRWIEGTGWFQA